MGVDLIGGNAGIALGALSAGDIELADLAVTPYLRTAEPTSQASNGRHSPAKPARLHQHFSHGTLGIVHALARRRASGRAGRS